jgi:hypothetical protein
MSPFGKGRNPMNVYKELNRLRVTLKNLTVLVLLTLVFQIGIIIILERLLRKTPFTRSVELLSPTNPSGTASPELNQSLNKILLGKFRDSEKTLLNIFEIRGPIGMFFVRPSVVPAPISVTGFVPTPRNSSEGFLGSLTRRALEVISCDYPEVPRESHRFIPFTIRVGPERKGVTFGVIR